VGKTLPEGAHIAEETPVTTPEHTAVVDGSPATTPEPAPGPRLRAITLGRFAVMMDELPH